MDISTITTQLKAPIPDFGNHTWRDPSLLEGGFSGISTSGPLSVLVCEKCGYKVNIHFGISISGRYTKMRVSYHYDPSMTCEKFKMEEALK